MPDITMCKNNKCSKKDTCYRFKAKPDTYQSYFIDMKEKDCDSYWSIKINEK